MLDVSFDFRGIEMAQHPLAEAFPHEQLRAGDVIRGHCCVGGAYRDSDLVAGRVGDILTVAIPRPDPADIADAMPQQGDAKMQPIARGNATDANMPTA